MAGGFAWLLWRLAGWLGGVFRRVGWGVIGFGIWLVWRFGGLRLAVGGWLGGDWLGRRWLYYTGVGRFKANSQKPKSQKPKANPPNPPMRFCSRSIEFPDLVKRRLRRRAVGGHDLAGFGPERSRRRTRHRLHSYFHRQEFDDYQGACLQSHLRTRPHRPSRVNRPIFSRASVSPVIEFPVFLPVHSSRFLNRSSCSSG